jgi:uncharacterized phage-associated protein
MVFLFMTTTAHDVAAYVLRQAGPMSHMKLQKLVYYAQAWSLVWDDEALFDDRIEAWANGPVVPTLYQTLKGKFKIEGADLPTGQPDRVSSTQRETIDRVLAFYGHRDSQWLSDLTHMERPWLDARRGLPAGARSSNEISLSSMSEYYSAL